MPARATGRHILNIEVSRTDSVTEAQVAEALYALQVKASPPAIKELTTHTLGRALVAIVKHLGQDGFYQAISLDDTSGLMEDAEQPPEGSRGPRRQFPR